MLPILLCSRSHLPKSFRNFIAFWEEAWIMFRQLALLHGAEGSFSPPNSVRVAAPSWSPGFQLFKSMRNP